MKGLCLGWTVFLCGAVVAVPASAQEGAQEEVTERDDEARGLFLAGSAAFERGHFEEALGYFQQAYDLSGRAGLLFNIGHTAERLRRDELALQSFERYLAEDPEADNRAQVERRIELLREALADREQEPPASAPPPVSPPPTDPTDDAGSPVGPIVTLAVGGAAVVGGIVLLALASSSASEVEDAPDGTPWTDVSDDYSAGTLGVAGGITLGLGAAALAAGLGWLVASGGGDDGTPRDDFALRVGPTGVDVTGSF